MMGDTVKVKLLKTHVSARVGDTVRAFGHDFVMQPNGDVVCDMHKDFIPTEVAAGRVEVIEPGKPRKDEIVPELEEFSFDPEDYFGTGSEDALKQRLTRKRKDLIQEFASTRLNVDIPESVANSKMIKQIGILAKAAHAQAKQENEDSDDK
jgi:hypothetical protein